MDSTIANQIQSANKRIELHYSNLKTKFNSVESTFFVQTNQILLKDLIEKKLIPSDTKDATSVIISGDFTADQWCEIIQTYRKQGRWYVCVKVGKIEQKDIDFAMDRAQFFVNNIINNYLYNTCIIKKGKVIFDRIFSRVSESESSIKAAELNKLADSISK